MKATSCKIRIEEKDFDIFVNVGAMINAEETTGKGFMTLVKEAEKGSVSAIANLLASCLKYEGKSVGLKFIEDMEIEVFQELFEPLIDCIIRAFPTASDKKKVIILTKVNK